MDFPAELGRWFGTRWQGVAMALHRHGNRVVPCQYCEAPAMWPNTECGECWEIASRLRSFLREGGLRATTFVAGELGRAVREKLLKRDR